MWCSTSTICLQVPLVLITGSCGPIGSEVSIHFSRAGLQIADVDDNQRAVFFGSEGDIRWTVDRLRSEIPGYAQHKIDIRDRAAMLNLLAELRPSVIIHTAAPLMIARPLFHSTISTPTQLAP
jgi:CDP-paratose 2-epimerase